MKKLISLIASLSLAATMVAPVFAASVANNAPVIETSFVELTASEFENDWVGEPLPADEKAYLVDVYVTGLDLENASAGKTNVLKKKRTGVLFMYGGYEIVFDSTDNVGSVYTMDGLAGGSTAEKTVKASFLATKSTEGHPVISDGTEATPATDAFLYQYVITTKGTVTGTVKGEAKVSVIDSDSVTETVDYTNALGNISYTVNGEATSAITFGAVAPDPDPEPLEDFVIENKRDLDSGWAWDVTINNYDSAATYKATFTAGSETKTNELFFEGAEVAEGGSIAFAALLKTTKAAVELALSK